MNQMFTAVVRYKLTNFKPLNGVSLYFSFANQSHGIKALDNESSVVVDNHANQAVMA